MEMTEREIQDLKKIIFITGEYYSKTLSAEVIQMRASDLQDLSFDEVRGAYEGYRRDPRNKFDPLPAAIRELARPTISDESLAREATGRIWTALSRFGYANPEEARKYIGELGWSVCGHDWAALCENSRTRDRGVFISQTYNQVMAKIELTRAGHTGPPELPQRVDRSQPLTAKMGDIAQIALKGKEL